SEAAVWSWPAVSVTGLRFLMKSELSSESTTTARGAQTVQQRASEPSAPSKGGCGHALCVRSPLLGASGSRPEARADADRAHPCFTLGARGAEQGGMQRRA